MYINTPVLFYFVFAIFTLHLNLHFVSFDVCHLYAVSPHTLVSFGICYFSAVSQHTVSFIWYFSVPAVSQHGLCFLFGVFFPAVFQHTLFYVMFISPIDLNRLNIFVNNSLTSVDVCPPYKVANQCGLPISNACKHYDMQMTPLQQPMIQKQHPLW